MEMSPEHMRKIMDPEVWTPAGERIATPEEIRFIGAIALEDNIVLGEN